jgi:hypothetical protein
VTPSEKTKRLNRNFQAVEQLPYPRQAQCVLIAAERCCDVFRGWQHEESANDFLATAKKWLNGEISAEEFDGQANGFLDLLPSDLQKEADPSAGHAGYSLCDVAVIGLNKCDDVHSDILVTSVLYAAAAACRVGHDAIWIKYERLTEDELDFIDKWWYECCRQVPELAEKMA